MKPVIHQLLILIIASFTQAGAIHRAARREQAQMRTALQRTMHPLTKL